MQIVFLSLSVIAGPARFFLGSLTVNDLIFSLIEVEHSVEFIEPRRLGLQFILLGERLLNLKLCVFELDLRVFELRFTGCQLLLEAVQGIVQPLDITENVGAQRYRMVCSFSPRTEANSKPVLALDTFVTSSLSLQTVWLISF